MPGMHSHAGAWERELRRSVGTRKILKKQFGSKLDLIIDTGATPGGAGSTVVCSDQNGLVILRRGVVFL